MHFLFTELRASYRVTEPFRLPHHSGSLLRGVLGRGLRAVACDSPPAPCPADCLHPSTCAYARLFDPPVPAPIPHRFLRSATRAPQPLIPLFPSPGHADLAPGATLAMGLRILGRLARTDAAAVLAALEELTTLRVGTEPGSGRIAVDEIGQVGPRDRRIDVPPADLAPAPVASSRVRVVMETPAWIAQKGRLLDPEELSFATLYRHTARRLTVLTALYGEADADDDASFQRLLPLAADVRTVQSDLRVQRWERLSLEKGVRHPMMGLLGAIVFEGPIHPFLPTLRAAEIAHIGKATSHGLGRIRLET